MAGRESSKPLSHRPPAELISSALSSHWLGDKMENLGLLHKDPDHPWLQELWLLGRYHGQYHWSEGSAGDDVGVETRRLRMGGQAKLFEKMTLHAQMVGASASRMRKASSCFQLRRQ